MSDNPAYLAWVLGKSLFLWASVSSSLKWDDNGISLMAFVGKKCKVVPGTDTALCLCSLLLITTGWHACIQCKFTECLVHTRCWPRC